MWDLVYVKFAIRKPNGPPESGQILFFTAASGHPAGALENACLMLRLSSATVAAQGQRDSYSAVMTVVSINVVV